MNDIPYEVQNIIFNKMDILTQLRFRCTCKYFNRHFQITNLFDIPSHIQEKLDDNVIIKYPHLEKLDASCPLKTRVFWPAYSMIKCEKITHLGIKKLPNLQVLNMAYNYNIGEDTIRELSKLTTLYIDPYVHFHYKLDMCNVNIIMNPYHNKSICSFSP